MGIRFHCPHCENRLHVKSFLAGKRGVCPKCGATVDIPAESELPEAETAPAPVMQQQTNTAKATSIQKAARPQAAPQAAPSDIAQPVRAATTISTPAPVKSHQRTNGASLSPATVEAPGKPSMAAAETADPIQESPQSVWYVRPPSGGQFGPARQDVMQRWIEEGRVTPDTFIWRDGWPDWRIASEVLPHLRAAAPRVPADAAPPPSSIAAGVPKIVPAPALPSAAASVLRYQKKKRERRGVWTAAVIVLSLLAVALIVTLIVVLRRP